MKTDEEIREFLNNKILININPTADEIIRSDFPKVETILIDEFLEWFKKKPKQNSQDIITIEGKEYEFINNGAIFCDGCDLRNTPICKMAICTSSKRNDGNRGQFKLKATSNR